MDSWIQTIILRLLKGWEVEFLCKTTEPMPHKWLYEAGKIVHQMFLGFPSLYESGKEDTATVNRKSMQGSTTCRAPQSDVPKCVDFGAGTLAWKIHCYSFFLTTCALQSFGFYYWQETWPRKVPITVNDHDQRQDIGNYTVQAIDKSSCQRSTLFSNHRKISHQTASARTRRKDIMKGTRGDGKALE